MSKLGITPKGNRVIIEQRVLETTTESGIIIQYEKEDVEQAAQIAGTVVAIAEACWDSWPEPWAKEGDEVYFAKYAGRTIFDPKTEKIYLVMNDIDIIAVIDEEI